MTGAQPLTPLHQVAALAQRRAACTGEVSAGCLTGPMPSALRTLLTDDRADSFTPASPPPTCAPPATVPAGASASGAVPSDRSVAGHWRSPDALLRAALPHRSEHGQKKRPREDAILGATAAGCQLRVDFGLTTDVAPQALSEAVVCKLLAFCRDTCLLPRTVFAALRLYNAVIASVAGDAKPTRKPKKKATPVEQATALLLHPAAEFSVAAVCALVASKVHEVSTQIDVRSVARRSKLSLATVSELERQLCAAVAFRVSAPTVWDLAEPLAVALRCDKAALIRGQLCLLLTAAGFHGCPSDACLSTTACAALTIDDPAVLSQPADGFNSVPVDGSPPLEASVTTARTALRGVLTSGRSAIEVGLLMKGQPRTTAPSVAHLVASWHGPSEVSIALAALE